jgi:hypothetical protein
MRQNLQAFVERDTAINNAADEFVTQFCGGSESVTETLSAVIYSLFDKYAPAPVPPQPTLSERIYANRSQFLSLLHKWNDDHDFTLIHLINGLCNLVGEPPLPEDDSKNMRAAAPAVEDAPRKPCFYCQNAHNFGETNCQCVCHSRAGEDAPRCRHGVLMGEPYCELCDKWSRGEDATPRTPLCDDVIEQCIEFLKPWCLGCMKKEKWVMPPKSSVVGQAAVHSSGMICIPNTLRALRAATPQPGEEK